MANSIFRFSGLILAGILWLACIPADQSSGFEDQQYSSLTWQQFMRSDAASQVIDLQNPDLDLLNAAVFFASNQARSMKRLPQFSFDPALRNMARYHSQQMARYHFVSHDNPRSPRYSSVEDRGRQFKAQVNAENVANTFLHQYRSGTRYYTKKSAQGDDLFFDSSSEEIGIHSYRSFARSIVKGWIDSPPHRRNLFHKQLNTLGCACEIGKDEVGSGEMPMAYCGQNFGMQ